MGAGPSIGEHEAAGQLSSVQRAEDVTQGRAFESSGDLHANTLTTNPGRRANSEPLGVLQLGQLARIELEVRARRRVEINQPYRLR